MRLALRNSALGRLLKPSSSPCLGPPVPGSTLLRGLHRTSLGTASGSMASDDGGKKRKLDALDSIVQPGVVNGDMSYKHTTSCSFRVPGLVVTNHRFRVPLDHSGGVDGEIDIFVREVVSHHSSRSLPYLLFLQGGPGFEAPRPTEASAWLKTAISSFRVILMDQRGTGRSSVVTVKNLIKRGSPAEQAQYLSFFRADSIIKDAEAVRKCLVPRDCYEGRWSVMGQSFGGFCVVSYLSLAPEGLMEAIITGGIPPTAAEPCSADAVYRALYARVIVQNNKYYQRYPGDTEVVQRIVRYLAAQPNSSIKLPSGSLLTPRAFQMLGMSGLGSGGGFDRLHYLLEEFFDSEGEVNPAFLKAFEGWVSFDSNPLYALLHESIYCQGAASNWAAHRLRETEYKQQFDAAHCADTGQRVLFTGEMVFPWMFEDIVGLRPYKAAAELLASKTDWPALYDLQKLAANKCPVAAATYLEDMYVDFPLSQATAAHMRGLRQWVTNEYKHSGIRDDGARIFDRLLSLARDTIPME